MDQALHGRTALVTGASGGIGRAIALRLAQNGARILAHFGTNEAGATQTIDAINESGGQAVALQADLTKVDQIEALFDRVDAELESADGGLLDILVNNAGLGGGGTIDQISEEHFDRIFETNVKGTFFTTRHALRRVRDGGRIINISSMVSRAAYPETVTYAMSKSALNSFTASLAVGLGPRGITVNAVAPGATETDFIARVTSDPQLKDKVAGQSVFGRLGQPDDVAEVVAFLASDAAHWVTGQVIEASGGMHL